jgi:hypothetical protein
MIRQQQESQFFLMNSSETYRVLIDLKWPRVDSDCLLFAQKCLDHNVHHQQQHLAAFLSVICQ